MLTLTESAAAYLDTAREQSGIPSEALVRIAPAATGNTAELGLGFVDQPLDGDQVGDAHGVGYCVAAEVADELAAAQLDVADGTLTITPATP